MSGLEFEDEDPEFEDLVLFSDEGHRGQDDGAALEPLRGYVRVNGPRGFGISRKNAAADAELRRVIGPGNARLAYYRVVLGVDFPACGGPRLLSAQVKLALSAVPDVPVPVALQLTPFNEGNTQKATRTLKVAPKANLPVVGAAELGDFEATNEYERTRLYVRAIGIEGSTPGWEFTRVPGFRLEGTRRLEVIVQAQRGAALTVSGTVTAQAAHGNLGVRYRRDLPHPLQVGPYTLDGG